MKNLPPEMLMGNKHLSMPLRVSCVFRKPNTENHTNLRMYNMKVFLEIVHHEDLKDKGIIAEVWNDQLDVLNDLNGTLLIEKDDPNIDILKDMDVFEKKKYWKTVSIPIIAKYIYTSIRERFSKELRDKYVISIIDGLTNYTGYGCSQAYGIKGKNNVYFMAHKIDCGYSICQIEKGVLGGFIQIEPQFYTKELDENGFILDFEKLGSLKNYMIPVLCDRYYTSKSLLSSKDIQNLSLLTDPRFSETHMIDLIKKEAVLYINENIYMPKEVKLHDIALKML